MLVRVGWGAVFCTNSEDRGLGFCPTLGYPDVLLCLNIEDVFGSDLDNKDVFLADLEDKEVFCSNLKDRELFSSNLSFKE